MLAQEEEEEGAQQQVLAELHDERLETLLSVALDRLCPLVEKWHGDGGGVHDAAQREERGGLCDTSLQLLRTPESP